ncbi:MAG: NAD(P)/FAD-dependent oxidoreductase [Solirubrobacterales bacterium]
MSSEEFRLGAWEASAPPHRSLWLQQALAAEEGAEPRPLEGRGSCDVCVVGGGYVGLWTALRLREADPACAVTVVEADICGGGASGRNGGIAFGWWAKFPSLEAKFGRETALWLCRETAVAVTEIGTFTREHAVECDYIPRGWLWAATTEAQRDAWAGTVRAVEAAGCEDVFTPLEGAELRRYTGSPHSVGGVLEQTGATVHPGRLARGLRAAAIAAGVEVRECSPVTSFEIGGKVRLRTPTAEIEADRVVLATNAWISRIPAFRRSCVPISSDVVATAPAPERLATLGWDGSEAVSNSRMMVNYYRPTADGRVVFGRGGGTLAFAGRVGTAFSINPRRCRETERDLFELIPDLRGVPVAHSWSGPIDRSATGMPWFGRLDRAGKVLYGVGFSGNGVAPSLLAGRTLSALALGRDDGWATSPLVSQRQNGFPPEPIRFLGGLLIRGAVGRKESAEARGARGSAVDRLLASLAPAGIYAAEEEKPQLTSTPQGR